MDDWGSVMRVLVCGGRHFADSLFVGIALMDIFRQRGGPECILTGACPTGVDAAARMFADSFHIPVIDFPADWDRYGRAAGPIRNQRMLDEGHPDLVIAFPGGRGTADMVRRARRAGVEVVEAKPSEDR